MPPLPTPHRAMSEFQKWIWNYFAVKRRRYYVAGLLIGLSGAAFGAIRELLFTPAQPEASVLPAVVAVSAAGVGAVWFLLFIERLNAKLQRDREDGNPAFGTRILLVLVGLVALVAIAVLVVWVASFFL